MKNILLMTLFCIAGLLSSAQDGVTVPYPMSASAASGTVYNNLDTVVNTDTTYLTFTAGAAYNMHFVATVTKITGTVAGAICLQGSDVGGTTNSNWDSLTNVVSGITVSNYNDYATVSNGTASYDWFVNGLTTYKYRYYRLRYISSGTQTSSFSGITYFRKPESD